MFLPNKRIFHARITFASGFQLVKEITYHLRRGKKIKINTYHKNKTRNREIIDVGVENRNFIDATFEFSFS